MYNVWVSVEHQDDTTGDGTDVGLPDKLYASTSLRSAQEFVRSLPGWKEQSATSDNRAVFCPRCGRDETDEDGGGYIERGEFNGSSYDAEGDVSVYRCLRCNERFALDVPVLP